MHAHKKSFSVSRTHIWYITAKQFKVISANRGYRGWSLIRANHQHSGDSNLIPFLSLLLPNDHHQIWQMGPRPVLMANIQEQGELRAKTQAVASGSHEPYHKKKKRLRSAQGRFLKRYFTEI